MNEKGEWRLILDYFNDIGDPVVHYRCSRCGYDEYFIPKSTCPMCRREMKKEAENEQE